MSLYYRLALYGDMLEDAGRDTGALRAAIRARLVQGGYGGDGGGGGGGYGDGYGGYGDGGNRITNTEETMHPGGLYILHCNDRNDIVGRVYTDAADPLLLRIEGAQVVRRGGTSAGLGQLASEGPLENTRVDLLPCEYVQALQVIYWIKCDEKAWQAKGHFVARHSQ